MVFQSYALYPHMSVYRNMAFGLENAHMRRAEIERRVARAARMLRLEPYLDRRPGALSGGQRQRAAIGRAMVYVTHDQVEAMTLASRIVVINAGRIEQVGTPLDLYNRPANAFVAGFIGSPRMNLFDVKVAGRTAAGLVLQAGGERITVAAALVLGDGIDLHLGVRPEHVRLVAAGAGDFDATVEHCEQLGAQTLVYAAAAGLPQMTIQQDGQIAARRGDRVGIALAREALHLFEPNGATIAGWRDHNVK